MKIQKISQLTSVKLRSLTHLIRTTPTISITGLSSLGVPGVPWHTQILADQLTLFQPGGTDNALLITTGTPGFSDLPTALESKQERVSAALLVNFYKV